MLLPLVWRQRSKLPQRTLGLVRGQESILSRGLHPDHLPRPASTVHCNRQLALNLLHLGRDERRLLGMGLGHQHGTNSLVAPECFYTSLAKPAEGFGGGVEGEPSGVGGGVASASEGMN